MSSIRNCWTDSVEESAEKYDFWENKQYEDWDVAIDGCLTDEEREYEEFQPMHNYRYHLPHFDEKNMNCEEMKDAVKHTNLTVVQDKHNDEYFLALTGTGMDMSWDICEAHINMGYLPPADFCRRLPRMGDMSITPSTEKVILGCKRSLTLSKGWAEYGLNELEKVEREIRGRGLGYKIGT